MAAATGTDDQHPAALHLDAEVVEALDETDAVEERAVEAAVGQAAHGVHGPGHAGHRVARIEPVVQRTLVRDRGPEPTDVLGLQRVFQEPQQRNGGQLQRHQHGIDGMALEQVVVDLGRTHLGHRIAEDVEDAGGAGDVHRGVCRGRRGGVLPSCK